MAPSKMIKTLFYTFLRTKQQEENVNSTDCNDLMPQEIEIRPITPWEILKTLTVDEVGPEGKFHIPMELVTDAILSHEPRDRICITEVQISSFQALVKDLDTNTVHNVRFWKKLDEDTFAMRGSWIKEFVERRSLVAGMVVGMYWDFNDHMLCFSVLETEAMKVGIPEFLSGIGEIGDLSKLLVTRTLKLKKFGIPCKHVSYHVSVLL